MKLTLTEKLNTFTPIACRLLARRKNAAGSVVAMTDGEIRDRSGLGMAVIKHLSWSESWDYVEVRHLLAFTRACGIDFDSAPSVKANIRYLKDGTWAHILRSPERDTFYRALLAEWRGVKGGAK